MPRAAVVMTQLNREGKRFACSDVSGKWHSAGGN